MSNDNYMPGTTDNDFGGENTWTDDRMEEAFRAGAQQMREMLARFVEQGTDPDPTVVALSMRLNWVPNWGNDPGPIKRDEPIADDLWSAIG